MVDKIDQDEGLPRRPSYNDLSRREVRSLIFHLLYAMEAFDYNVSLEAIVEDFNRAYDLDIPGDSEVISIAQTVIDKRDELDTQIRPLLINWRFERIGICTKLILRMALWELLNTDIAPNIIINEAIELAKCFSESDAYKFVNGILDEAVKSLKKDDKKEDS